MPVSVSWPANEPSFSASATNGLSLGAPSAVIEGKFTALVRAPRTRYSAICSAICSATFSCASVVEAPRCGVQTTFGSLNSGLSVAGSVMKTSRAPQAKALLGQLERIGIDDVAGLFGQRRMQRDEIGAAQ